ATCPHCRAFAYDINAMAAGLRELPYLPPSAAVSRGVMAHVEQGRSPWTRFSGVLSAKPGPAFSTLAVIVIVLLLGVFVANRFLLDNGSSDDGNGQLAARPTLQSETPRSAVMLTT